MKTLTYDILFNDDSNSNNKGFAISKQEAIDYIHSNNGTDYDYFEDYVGGVVSVICNETEEIVYEEIVREKQVSKEEADEAEAYAAWAELD